MSTADVHLFPVRHHSPRAAACLLALLDSVRPKLILIEGPNDANHLIPALTDTDSEPPIAILAYRSDGVPHSVMWPFARYSPEYQALIWARDHGVPARFIDWASGMALAVDLASEVSRMRDAEPLPEPETRDHSDPVDEADATGESPRDALAARFGLRHFNEFWDAYFEVPQFQPDAFRDALNGYADWLCAQGDRDPHSRLRDAAMSAAIQAEIAAGTAATDIVAVLGAAHVAALLRPPSEPEIHAMPTPLPSALAVVPYSYPRLSEDSGYGAGNRAPWYYERAYNDGLDYAKATLTVLLEFSANLRLRGFAVSLADVIEAYRLALTLAAMREKSAPGLDELAEAAQATLTRGEAAPIQQFLRPLLIGQRVGQLGASAGRNSLQLEFDQNLVSFGLPRRDEPETVTVRLNDARQLQASLFLHRLRVAQVPYASYAGSQSVVSRGASAQDQPGGYGALSRLREHWDVQWTPATEVGLAEAVVYGEHFAAVCERRLEPRITNVERAAAATDVLIDAVLCEAPQATAHALAAAERLSSLDDDVASLAGAARTLTALASYGSSRPSLKQIDATVALLLQGTYTRALLRLPLSLHGDAAATAPARQAMRVLNELALGQRSLDRDAYFAVLREIAQDEMLEATAAGVAAALLYMAQCWDEDALHALLQRRLGDVIAPLRAAEFLVGFFEVNALVVLKNRALVATLSEFLMALEPTHFRDVLPALRRAFGELGASERRYLLEHLVGLHASAAVPAAATVLTATDRNALSGLGMDLSQVMDDLDDLL